jgi:threonine synthase
MERLVCPQCHATYLEMKTIWRCTCGSPLDLDFKPHFDLERIANRKLNMWRYREALPLPAEAEKISFEEGFTPLLPVDFDGKRVLVKQDQLFPSGSYKDRGAAVMISKIKSLGVREVVEDSSGNAGSAVAAYCARAGIACSIYAPADTSPGKLAQIQAYGAALQRIPGSREETSRAVRRRLRRSITPVTPGTPISFTHQDLRLRGVRTARLAHTGCGGAAGGTWNLAVGRVDWVWGAVPGRGDSTSAETDRRANPGMFPLYDAFVQGKERFVPVEKQDSLAEGFLWASRCAIADLGGGARQWGNFLAVSEAEILESYRTMARQGHYIEPTSAAVMAGVSQYLQQNNDEVIVSVFTGNGLKAGDKALKVFGEQARFIDLRRRRSRLVDLPGWIKARRASKSWARVQGRGRPNIIRPVRRRPGRL